MALKDIIVPTMGESVSEATIAKWFKQVGESVKQDEPVAELETDKVTLEVNSPVSGVLKEIIAAQGSNVEVGALLGRIEEGAVQTAEVKAAKPEIAAVKSDVVEDKSGPAARKIAEETGVNLAAIATNGKDGRATKADVLNAASSPTPVASAQVATSSAPREERVKMTKLRQTIAKRLKDSQNTAAILTTFNEIDMSNIIA
ncbi:MAG: biotin/lipoyl-containing protein, partial [Pseudomonadota bacterium]